MKKYELYEQALKQIKQLEQEKAQAIKTIEELCAEWNIELSNNQAQIVNNITINKGKIVKVTVADNSSEEYIEQLLNDLQNRNNRIEQLKAQLEKEQQDYRDLEYEAKEEIESVAAIRDKKIADLEDIIEELNNKIDIQQEELEYYHGKEKEYEEDVEGMEMDNEALKLQMEGMKFAYENEIAQLKSQVSKLTAQLYCMETEVFEEEEEEIVSDVEGGDAVGPQFMDIPDKYKDHPEIIETIKDFTEKWNNAEAIRGAGLTREQVQESHIMAANQTLETIISELEEADKYNISFTKLLNNKNNTVVAIVGRITLGGQEYPFKYGATHKLPCIYGCYDKALIEEAKEALGAAIRDMIKDETTEKHVYEVVYEMDKGLVVWQTDDGAFKGYARAKSQRNGKRNSYAFVWDGTSAVPTACWCNNMYVRKDNGQHMTTDEFMPMNKRRGAGIASLGQEIMAFCKTIDKRTVKETKEIVKETKEETLNVAQEVDELDI